MMLIKNPPNGGFFVLDAWPNSKLKQDVSTKESIIVLAVIGKSSYFQSLKCFAMTLLNGPTMFFSWLNIFFLSIWIRIMKPSVDYFAGFPKKDSEWTEKHWRLLIEWFLNSGLLTARELASLMLGHLNPSQVGTSIASKETFQAHYPPRKTMQAVIQWHFQQTGKCKDCGTRLELQADHVIPREEIGDAADRLDNMILRCRRCNVIRRPSHKHGGKTFLTAEAALMWILFVRRPKTYQEYETLCREYGMTMANIRFQEAWAMAHWLEREGLYEMSEDSTL